jgi:diacylglycerol kinase family enzyme
MSANSQPAGVVLLNPHANGGKALALRRPIEAWLARNSPGVALLVPDSVDQAQATLAILASRSRVVLVGGDGTLHRMLPAILRCGHRIGLVPAGKRNDTAHAIGIDVLQWPEALAYALHAPAGPVDLGQLDTETETRHFVSSLCAGFDAGIAQGVTDAPHWLRGTPRYLWAGAQAWPGLRSRELRLWVNGQLEHDGPALMVSVHNTATGHGGIPAAPGARIDDHRLDTLVVGRTGRLRVLPLLWRLSQAHHIQPPRVSLHGTRKMLVDATEPLPLTVDGEALAPVARFSVHVLPRTLYIAGAQMLAERLSESHLASMRSGLDQEGLSDEGPSTLPSN